MEKNKNFKILTVDDDEAIRSTLTEILEDEGFETVNAKNGRVAYDYLMATSDAQLPQLIFLDYMMPVMDGENFCKSKSDHPRLKHIPIVMMTASGNLINLMDKVENEADAYISKPMDLDVVIDMVKHFNNSNCNNSQLGW